jgi:hypothetical protein
MRRALSREGLAAPSSGDAVWYRVGSLPKGSAVLIAGIARAGFDGHRIVVQRPSLMKLRAHLSALMPYRVAADVLGHLLPIEASIHHETLRSHTLKAGEHVNFRDR